ncbi:caspase family protein [Bradyrhizobium sp. SRS-191]|uniref:caspase family protein n=1 Tax=Bradyrhizobium sp. SRS-191 TaxID=2962606 RepID=UPI00211DEC0F|nr:caspase family protein [Bradyrhizobium sp. SRS-191]
MGRRACLAIGVANVLPVKANAPAPFANLDGAVIAARALGDWARCSEFGPENVAVVDDGRVDGKANPVTTARVQQAVDALLSPDRGGIDHLLLAFCGHGLTDANVGSISWLFSDSLLERYRVVADNFIEELLHHDVQRITLISDACREAPKDFDLIRLAPVRGITVQGERVESPKFDRFSACQDGQQGFMVVEENSNNPGKCIFSGVIVDVLWGKEPSAISNDVITTNTFGVCVRNRTVQRARDYRLKLNPQCQVDPEAAVLYDKNKPPSENGIALQPWPAVGAASIMGQAPAPDAAEAGRNLELIRTDASFRDRVLGPGFGLNKLGFGVSKETPPIPRASEDMLHDLIRLRVTPSNRSRRGTPETRRAAEAIALQLEADAVAEARAKAAGEFRRSVTQIKPSSGPDGSNLIVAGDAKLWSRQPPQSGRHTSVRMGFRVDADPAGMPVLVELADGSFVPVVPYDALYVVVKPSAAGDVMLAYGEHDAREAFRNALAAIADFAAGRIGPDQLAGLAARLMLAKHVDPALGAICAHLYRAMADFDSIRRLAYVYVAHEQAVPFDIALLGAMDVVRGPDGALTLEIPDVKARRMLDVGPDLPDFVVSRTPAARARIAGRCPWLAAGWDYVTDPRPAAAALVEGLAEHAAEIRRSGFTVLPAEVGRQLARRWGLTPQ